MATIPTLVADTTMASGGKQIHLFSRAARVHIKPAEQSVQSAQHGPTFY
jgi:hypothetical protein